MWQTLINVHVSIAYWLCHSSIKPLILTTWRRMRDRHLPRLTCQQNGQLSPPPKFSQFPDRSRKFEGQERFSILGAGVWGRVGELRGTAEAVVPLQQERRVFISRSQREDEAPRSSRHPPRASPADPSPRPPRGTSFWSTFVSSVLVQNWARTVVSRVSDYRKLACFAKLVKGTVGIERARSWTKENRKEDLGLNFWGSSVEVAVKRYGRDWVAHSILALQLIRESKSELFARFWTKLLEGAGIWLCAIPFRYRALYPEVKILKRSLGWLNCFRNWIFEAP